MQVVLEALAVFAASVFLLGLLGTKFAPVRPIELLRLGEAKLEW